MCFEKKKGGGPAQRPQNPKKIQEKTRKWVKKKNGLYGWVTSVGGPSKSKAPQKLAGGGGLKTNKGFQNEGGGWTADGGSGSNPNDESES